MKEHLLVAAGVVSGCIIVGAVTLLAYLGLYVAAVEIITAF